MNKTLLDKIKTYKLKIIRKKLILQFRIKFILKIVCVLSRSAYNILYSIAHLFPNFTLFLGWYEGICLSDGQKGWFPVANVLEITNEHVRRRNLRERYRVMQAASIVNKTRTVPKGATS